MAHVRRRNDAWYIVDGGKEYSGRRLIGRPFASRDEALLHMPPVVAGNAALRQQATLGGWLDHWLALQQSTLKETTWAGYERVVGRLPMAVALLPLEQLHVDDIERLYMEMLADGLAPGTVRQTHAVLGRALDLAVQRGRLERNPVRGATVPRIPEREYRTWGLYELRKFLDAALAHGEWYALFLTAVTTGLRRGELLGLQPGDVHPDHLYVQRSVTWTGKRVVVTSPKTRAGRRQVALDDWTAEALRFHRGGETWLWSEGADPPDPHQLNRRFARLTRLAGLEPIRFHDLRHSHATAALAAGAPLAAMSERLGHHDTAFTARVYQHTDLTMQRQLAQQLAAPLFQNEKSPTLGEGGALSL